MKLQYFRKTFSERGTYLIVLSGIFVAVLSVLGLALDVANLQRAKLRMQRAVDTSAINAVYRFDDGLSNSALETMAEQIVRENLLHVGFSTGSIPFGFPNATVSNLGTSNPRQITIDARVNVNLHILKIIPGLGSIDLVSASAVAVNRKVYAALVLDTSGSMLYPSTKAANMKLAAKAFVDRFADNDFLSVVRFSVSSSNSNAQVVFSMQQMSPSNRTAVKNAIDAMNIQSGATTNGQDGILLGRQQINSQSTLPTDFKSMVYLSDGAPWSSGSTSWSCNSPLVSPSSTSTGQQQRRYLRTINNSDLARASGITVYTVGLGPKGEPVLLPPTLGAAPTILPRPHHRVHPRQFHHQAHQAGPAIVLLTFFNGGRVARISSRII